jgi:hypothetical protein
VSVQLARRLLQRDAISRAALEQALLDSVQRRVGLVRALCDHDPAFSERLELELGALDVPAIRTVRAVPDLCAALPASLCEALLVVPVRRDPRSGAVDVAAVDPLDPHLVSELSSHLRAPIRVLRAPYAAVQAALQALQALVKPERHGQRIELVAQQTPAFGLPGAHHGSNRAPKRQATLRPSPDPVPTRSSRPAAIPLVRRPANAKTSGETSEALGIRPILTLRPEAPREPSQLPIETLALAASADEVVGLLLSAAAEIGRVVVFGVRGTSYEGRGASGPGLSNLPVRTLRLKRSEPSILRTASEAGYYLGSVPETPVHARIKALLNTASTDEVYVVPVNVAAKTVLVVLVARFERAFIATRYADRLAAAAATALERILRARKRR